MKKLVVRLMVAGLACGLAVGMGAFSRPAGAQDSGIANTAEDFKSADSNDGILGSDMDIWDLFHSASTLSGAGVVDEGFQRSQSRRINRQAESLRQRQREILDSQSATDADASVEDEATKGVSRKLSFWVY